MRIGIFGGSFDPIHLGHLIVAESAADQLRLDRVHFVPARQQPFKVGAHGAAVEDRVAMLEAAIADNPRFAMDRREVDRDGPSYTIDTLRSLRAENPGDQLFLLVGADAGQQLSTWRDAHALPELAFVAVLTRPGFEPVVPAGGQRIEVPAIGISASAIRAVVCRGDSIRYRVPAPVAAYIAAHRLYGSEDSC